MFISTLECTNKPGCYMISPTVRTSGWNPPPQSADYNKHHFFYVSVYVWSGLHNCDSITWMTTLSVLTIVGIHCINIPRKTLADLVHVHTLMSMSKPVTGRYGLCTVRWKLSCCISSSSSFRIISDAFSRSPLMFATNCCIEMLNSSTLQAK